MEAWKEYLLRIVAAALISGIALSLVSAQGAVGGILRLLCGIWITVQIVSPVLKLPLPSFPSLWQGVSAQSDALIETAKEETAQKLRTVIQEQTQTYILEKARSLDACIQVSVTLTDESLPVPQQARIRGDVSPYAKQTLSTYMEQELGISREAQIWE